VTCFLSWKFPFLIWAFWAFWAFWALGSWELFGRWELRGCGVDREAAQRTHGGEVPRSLGAGEAVVGEEHEAGGAETARGLDVLDGLRRGEAVGADAGPHGARTREGARRADL